MKKLLTVLLTIAMAFTLGACSNNGGGNEGGEATTGEKTKVVIWHTYTEEQQAYIDEAVATFNAEHEDIEVVVETQPRKDFESKVMQAVSNGVGPNMIIHYASEAANYVQDGLVADLGKYVSEDFASTVDAGAYKEATSFEDGKLHILPLITSGPIFIYNKTIYDELGLEAPATWDELVANCEAIKAKYPEKYGFAFDSLTDGGQTLIMQTGNELIDASTKTVTFNTPEVEKQINWFADGVKNQLFMLKPTEQYFSNDFNTENLVTYIGSVAGIPYLQLPEGSEFATAPVPQGGNVEWTPAWNRGIIVFSADEKTEAATAEFAKYFASPEVNAKFCEVANYATPYQATRDTETYKAFVAANTDLANLRPEIGGSFAAITGVAGVRTQIEELLNSVAIDAKTATQALADAEAACNDALQGN